MSGKEKDPIIGAIHLNTAKQWEQALGKRVLEDEYFFENPRTPSPAEDIDDVLKRMHS